MKQANIEFHPATKEHVREFYGENTRKSFRGYVAIMEGKVVAVGGISNEGGNKLLFSDLSEDMRPFKKDIVRAIRVLRDMVGNIKTPIYAIAHNTEALSEKLLFSFGFLPTGENTLSGKVFRREP